MTRIDTTGPLSSRIPNTLFVFIQSEIQPQSVVVLESSILCIGFLTENHGSTFFNANPLYNDTSLSTMMLSSVVIELFYF